MRLVATQGDDSFIHACIHSLIHRLDLVWGSPSPPSLSITAPLHEPYNLHLTHEITPPLTSPPRLLAKVLMEDLSTMDTLDMSRVPPNPDTDPHPSPTYGLSGGGGGKGIKTVPPTPGLRSGAKCIFCDQSDGYFVKCCYTPPTNRNGAAGAAAGGDGSGGGGLVVKEEGASSAAAAAVVGEGAKPLNPPPAVLSASSRGSANGLAQMGGPQSSSGAYPSAFASAIASATLSGGVGGLSSR